MLTLAPTRSRGERLELLFLGAHSDDIEIGCGATVLQLGAELGDAAVHWVVFSAEGSRAEEARESAQAFLSEFRQSRITVEVLNFRNAFFPCCWQEIKEFFEHLKSRCAPDLIFTHHKEDLHQDHRILAELTWNTFRDHLILEYEVPKYDGGLGSPNLFVPLTRDLCDRKVDILLGQFHSQKSKKWFTRELFMGLMRLRGLEGCSPGDYAEAFHCRKSALAWSK